MAAEALLYILFISVLQPQKDLPRAVLEVARVLDSNPTNLTIVHAVKVSAEAEFIAVVQVENNAPLDNFATTLWSKRNVVIRSIPVIDGNTFATYLGVPDNLTTSENRLSNERLFFEEIELYQSGKTTEEILDGTRQQIEMLLTLRARGDLSVEFYKTFEKNKTFRLINIPDVPEYELLTNVLPLRVEYGVNVNIIVKGVQFVKEYIAGSQ